MCVRFPLASETHLVWVGGRPFFQLSSVSRLAKNDKKAKKPCWLADSEVSEGGEGSAGLTVTKRRLQILTSREELEKDRSRPAANERQELGGTEYMLGLVEAILR